MRPLVLLLALTLLGCKGSPKPPSDEVPPYPGRSQKWRAHVLARLRKTRVTLNLKAVPVELVVREIGGKAGVNVYLDPELTKDPKVDLQVIFVELSDVPADQALHEVLDPLGLEWKVQEDLVLVTKLASRPDSLKEDDGELIERAQEARASHEKRLAAEARLDAEVSVECHNLPIDAVLRDLSKQAGVPIEFDSPALVPPKGSPGVTLSLSRVRLASVLHIILETRSLGCRWRGAELRVVTKDEADRAARLERADLELRAKPVTLDAKDVPLRDLAAVLEKAASVRVLLDEETWNRRDRVTFRATDEALHEVLARITRDAKCDTILSEGVVYFLSPSK